MSRRRGEFEHRTSIFEGAYRAWSHLGGLEPDELESRSALDLDPLDHPLIHDKRLKEDKRSWTDEQGIAHKFYFYEPLPRAGLSHPYVQAILSPWLGPEADHDAIQLGLTTLRTWWQHRRKGESASAVAALHSEKMRDVVEGYTRHFFNLAYCLVVNDREQAPRTLSTKIKTLEKMRKKLKREIVAGQQGADSIANMASYTSHAAAAASPPTNPNLTPLEKLHAAQRRQLAESVGISSLMGTNDITAAPLVNMKGKCIPGNINLFGMIDEINHHATQLSHRGGGTWPNQVGSFSRTMIQSDYGDPNMTPVVFVSENGDIQIAMEVDGITCAHCVKIVETVLKGCSGTKSPIDGILDAAADRMLCQVLIKIEKSSDAKRIAFEASRNLSMVGYTAKVKEMSVVNAGGDRKATMDLGALSTAFEVIATTDPQDVFDWYIPCACPDNGILRTDCPRCVIVTSNALRFLFSAFHFVLA
jgi:copper chaperone CopZ